MTLPRIIITVSVIVAGIITAVAWQKRCKARVPIIVAGVVIPGCPR
jgi:hypothetical protein